MPYKDKEVLKTVHLKFLEEELEEIDEWQRLHHIRTRSEAIRQMIRRTIETGDDIYGLAEKGTGFASVSHTKHKSPVSEEVGDIVKETVREELARLLGNNKKNG